MPSVAQVLHTQPGEAVGGEGKRRRQKRTKPQVKRQKKDTNCDSDATRERLDSKNYYEVIPFLCLLICVKLIKASACRCLDWA